MFCGLLVDKNGMAVLNKKVQLAILDKIAECSEGNPVMLDSLTLDEQFNFKYLSEKGCLQPILVESATNIGWRDVVGATELTEKGQEFRLKLIDELEMLTLRRLSVEAMQGANRRATCAMLISIICAFIVGSPSIISFLRWWFSS